MPVDDEPQLSDLLAALEMLAHLVAFKVLPPAARHRAAVGRVLELALVAQAEAFRQLTARQPRGHQRARRFFGVRRLRREGFDRFAENGEETLGLLA